MPRWLTAVLAVLLVGVLPALAAPAERRLLAKYQSTDPTNPVPVARMAASANIKLAIGLPLRNEADLDELLRQIYDPQSTNYHHFIGPQEFTDRFGPSEADYEAVAAFARANGLTVTRRHPNRVVLDVSGSVSNIEQMFQVKLQTYRHPTEPRNYYAPDTAPSLPANLPVADVWGLSDFGRPHPMVERVDVSKITPANYNGTGQFGEYQGADFRHAYVPGSNLAGSGQTAAVAEFDGYYPADITNYENRIGYTNVPLQNVYVDDVSGIPGYGGVTNAVIEVSLDIELIIAMAPALSNLMVYEGNSPYDVFSQIVNDDVAKQISCSWFFSRGPEYDWEGPGSTLDSLLKQMGVQGQSFFEASGDDDAYTGAGSLSSVTGPVPVDSVYVTSVGGTSLSMNGSGGSWASETVWNVGNGNGSGGGISPNYKIPTWQKNVSMAANSGSTKDRNIPDVALTADAISVLADNGQTVSIGGTSCAAPLWAGFCALINQQAAAVNATNVVGFLNPALYAISTGPAYAACFHDITTGNNIGNNTAGLYNAVTGYDLCTGLGTPAGTNLINLLAPPLAPCVVLPPASQTVINGSRFTLTAVGAGQAPLSYSWLFNGTNLAAGTNFSGLSSNILSIASVTTNNAGNYSVVITNSYGAVTSSVAALTIAFAPSISVVFTNEVIHAGANVSFSVSATGTAPLTYSWLKNGVLLPNQTGVSGATSSQLTLLSVTTNSSATYSAVVANGYGTVTNAVAAVTVVQPPVITTPLAGQTIECSSNATFTVTAIGTAPLAYLWTFDGSVVQGASGPSLTFTNVHLPDHTVAVLITNLYGVTADTVSLNVQDTQPPVIALNGPNPLYVELGTAFVDPGATAVDACAGVVPVVVSGTVITNTLSTNELVYSASDGDGNTSTATRVVIVQDTIPPVIQWSFTNLVLAAGPDCDASMIDVTGTNYIIATDAGGPPVITQSPTTNDVLSIGTNVVILTATDIAGNTSYSTNEIVVEDESPPVIFGGPQSETNSLGDTVTFALTATACTPVCYQWSLNGTNLTDQTNSILTLADVAPANAGIYAVVATAAGGSSTSAPAVLTINVPLQLTAAEYSDAGMVLNLTGPPDDTFIVQMTTDLTLPDGWQSLGTNTFDDNGSAQFIDSSATDPQRFYRILLDQ